MTPRTPAARRLVLIATLALAAGSAQAAYQKVSNSGAFLPNSAALGAGPNDWACTYDTDTKLLWEVKASDGGLRDWSKNYTNYDDPSQPQVYVSGTYPNDIRRNPTQAEIDAPTNSIGFVNAVNAQGLCGFKDWRRPTGSWAAGATPADQELQSLFNPSTWDYKDINYFPSSSARVFWSGSPVAGFPGGAWGVFRLNGIDFWDGHRDFALAVRLVRAGPLFDILIQTAGTGAGQVSGGAVACVRDAAGATSGVCATMGTGDAANPRIFTGAPAAGASFAGWAGCDSQTADVPPKCEVSASAARTVTATFLADGVKTFSGTTVPASGASGAASASFTGGGSTCGFDAAGAAFIAGVAPPPGKTLP